MPQTLVRFQPPSLLTVPITEDMMRQEKKIKHDPWKYINKEREKRRDLERKNKRANKRRG